MARPSKNIRESYPYLIVLSESLKNKKLRKALVENPKLLSGLTELILNLLQENIPLTPQQRKNLRQYQRELLTLVRKEVSSKHKTKALSGQRGDGFLSTVLSVGLPVLASWLMKKHGRHSNN